MHKIKEYQKYLKRSIDPAFRVESNRALALPKVLFASDKKC